MANNDRVSHVDANLLLSRRTAIAAFLASSLCVSRQSFAEPVKADLPLVDSSTTPTFLTRVKSVLEVKGTIQIKPSKEAAARVSQATPIESKTTLEFEEAIKAQTGSVNRFSVQLYSQAECVNDIQKYATTTKLRDDCITIVGLADSQGRSINCPENPLTASERDLVQGAISTSYLDVLLPTAAIQLGDKWWVEGIALARLLNLAKVDSGKLKVTLIAADKKIGQLEMSGDITGEVKDVKTAIKIEGKASVDRSTGLVTWVAVTIQEKRQVGESEPGFDVTARLRILRESIEKLSQAVDVDDLQKKAESEQSAELTMVHSKLGAYKFIADKGWTLYTDSGVDASLRWVQKNHTFAQCSITNLTDTAPGEQLSIAGYQGDIQKSMGKQLGQMLEATERLTNSGLRMMRVVSIGTVDQVPMQWIHILVSNDAGRHLSLVFTMNAASADRFDSQDLQIADTLEFTLRQLPTAPKEKPTSDSEEKPAAETAALKSTSAATK